MSAPSSSAKRSLVQTDEPGLDFALARTAWIGGVFCALVCIAMLMAYLKSKALDPLKAPQLIALKEQLLASPKDEQLKIQIRSLDLQLRRRYFRRSVLDGTGAFLALGGLLVFVISAKDALRRQRQLPLPGAKSDSVKRAARITALSRWSVTAVGCLVGAALVGTAFSSRTGLSSNAVGVENLLGSTGASGGGAGDFAPLAEMRQDWPRFRGADGNGVTTETNLPVSWDAKTGTGIIWKSEVPAPGFNSPIVWGSRVFLSGADAAKQELICFNAATGELTWRQSISNPAGTAAPSVKVPEQTGFAASTAATDGRRVYVIFANGDLAAFNLEGKQVWFKNLGTPKNPHGHATSLATWEGRLIVQLDQGEAEQNASKLYLLDGATGQVVWQRGRPVPASWATPIIIISAGRPQIVALGVPWILGYAMKDGTELWRADGLANEVTPSPIFANGLVFAISPNEKILAIRPDGQGDVTKTHIAWTAEDNIPDIASPVSTRELVFTVSTPGMLTCYDAKDGKKQWEQDLGMECNASLTVAGTRVYAMAIKGTTVVFEAARSFKEIARGDLGEKVYASPAIAHQRIYIRGEKHLFCIGAAENKLAKSN